MNRLITRISASAVALALLLGVTLGATPFSAVAQDTETFVPGDAVVVFDGTLNLREAPGLDADVIEVLADGTALTVLDGPQGADAIPWYQVSTADETTGWVSGEFITAANDGVSFSVGDSVVVANGPLNMRDAAGTDATILDTLDTGATATILGGPTAAGDFDWYQIELGGGETGWVAGDFLGLASDDTGDFAAGDVVTTTARLNLRGGASLSGTVIETLDVGTTGTILDGPSAADDFSWYQIEATDGETGWVAGEFLALDDDTPNVPGGGDFPIDSFIFVNAPVVNLRDDASITAEVQDQLDEGTMVTVLDGPVAADDYTWYQVAVGEGQDTQQGWVAGSLMSGGIALNAEAVVLDGPLNLREEAGTSSDAIAALEVGDIVTVLNGPVVADGDAFLWFEVESGEDTGFVAGQFLGMVEE
jgi:uncharacterized protein YgiM (DUF1202 family)